MSFSCPLCREEWCFVAKLCESCDRVRYLMSIYSRDKILEILDKTLIVQQFKKTENGDDTYIKPKTRSKSISK